MSRFARPFVSISRVTRKGWRIWRSRCCARALGARHRGCVQRRERPAVVIEDSGVAAWGAAVGGLPGVCPARLERIRDHLSVCRRHCRAFEAWRQTRACFGGLGLYDEGRSVLLHMMAGSKEDAETVTAFFEDMKRRGLNDPLLVTSDGAPGIIKAIEICFPRAARQRCLAHRMRNLAA